MEFAWNLAVTPLDQLLIINLTDPLLPVFLTNLPNKPKRKRNFPINNIHTINTNQLQIESLSNLKNIVTVLHNMDPTGQFIRIPFVPVYKPRLIIIEDFEQDATVAEIVHQVVYEAIFDALGIYPVFEDAHLAGFVGFGLWGELDYFYLFLL